MNTFKDLINTDTNHNFRCSLIAVINLVVMKENPGTNLALAGGKNPAISPSIYGRPTIVQLIKLQAWSWDQQFSPGMQQNLKNILLLSLKEMPQISMYSSLYDFLIFYHLLLCCQENLKGVLYVWLVGWFSLLSFRLFEKHGFSVQLWLLWNLLCRLD